jgi:hypothetical protein
MCDGEQELNRQDAPMQGGERGVHSSAIVAVVACIAMVLLSIAVSAHAIFRILETTPFMGIPVDARGNRIPIQGYPELWFGVTGVCLFTVLAVTVWLDCERIHFSLRTLLFATTLVAVLLGLGVYLIR